MKESCEAGSQFLIKRTDFGIYVDDLTRGLRFFQARSGAWFLLSDGNSLFDEDAVVTSKMADYLNELIKSSDFRLSKVA